MEVDMLRGLNFDISQHASRSRVLMVDDESIVRNVVSSTLSRAGYDVVEAEDGAKAIDSLDRNDQSRAVDLIISDIRMPVINGSTAITYFLTRYPSIPIIVLTGYPDRRLADSLLKEGVAEYLVKPVSQAELLASVSSVIDRQRLWFYQRCVF
jgi:two-component system chemotaxis response regulator CheY